MISRNGLIIPDIGGYFPNCQTTAMENWSLLLSGAVLIFLQHPGRQFARHSPQSAAFDVAAFCIYLKSAEAHQEPSQSEEPKPLESSANAISNFCLFTVSRAEPNKTWCVTMETEAALSPSNSSQVCAVVFFSVFK